VLLSLRGSTLHALVLELVVVLVANVRNVGRKLGRSMRMVNRAANHVNIIANAVTNVRNTVNSFRGNQKPR